MKVRKESSNWKGKSRPGKFVGFLKKILIIKEDIEDRSNKQRGWDPEHR